MLEFQVKWNEVSLTLENKIIKICQIFYALTDQIVRLGKTVLEAYILINTEPGIIWKVAEAALKIEGVKMAQAVTGQFDAVTYVEFTKIEDLRKIIEEIQQLKGVRRTQSLIAIPPTVRE